MREISEVRLQHEQIFEIYLFYPIEIKHYTYMGKEIVRPRSTIYYIS